MSHQKHLFSLSLLLFLPFALSKLQILAPASLKSQFPNGTIPASYANFGYIPYGHSIAGKFFYDEKDVEACDLFYEEHPFAEDFVPFFLAYRGDCTFTKKVRNMENAGAAMGIIIDNVVEHSDILVMMDDGTGGGITIPSMIISEEDGEALLAFLKNATEEELQQMTVMASFDLNRPDNRVEYDLWYTSSNDKALDFIAEFTQTDQMLGEKVLFTPHFVFWRCTFCDPSLLEYDCFSGGRYCAIDSDNDFLDGREIILEDLRQKCLYQETYRQQATRYKWWAYMKQVHRNCYLQINEECSRQAHLKLSLNFTKTKECVENSFSDKDWTSHNTKNSIIDEEITYWMQYGSGIYPSIVINNVTYRGQFEKLSVYNALCAGFQDAPEICQATFGEYTPDELPDDFRRQMLVIKATKLVPIVLAFVLLNVLAIYCYRRYQRREMQSEMQVKIESAVSQYFALSQGGGTGVPYVK